MDGGDDGIRGLPLFTFCIKALLGGDFVNQWFSTFVRRALRQQRYSCQYDSYKNTGCKAMYMYTQERDRRFGGTHRRHLQERRAGQAKIQPMQAPNLCLHLLVSCLATYMYSRGYSFWSVTVIPPPPTLLTYSSAPRYLASGRVSR